VHTPDYGPQLPVNHREGFTWYLVFLPMVNGLIPIICAWVLAQPNSVFRADFHLLALIVTLVINVFCFVGSLALALLVCSTVNGAGCTACNPVSFCCSYATSLPGECPSLNPCVPGAPSQPGWSAEWSQHVWITFSFIFLLLFQWAENSNIRVTGLVKADENREESTIISLIILMGSAIAFYWFQAFVLANLSFINGYPALTTLAPGPFISNLYGLQWVAVYLLNANFIPILLLIAALFNEARHEFFQKAHLRVTSLLVLPLNIVIVSNVFKSFSAQIVIFATTNVALAGQKLAAINIFLRKLMSCVVFHYLTNLLRTR
jgi:hypothetical protein